MGGLLDRIDQWQRSRRGAAFGFAVIKKFGQDSAGNLAALIAYYSFFSIFPLLLALVTILGYVTAGNAHLSHDIFCDGFGKFPIISSGINCGSTKATGTGSFKPLTGNAPALIIGVLLAVYSGLSVAKTAQQAFNDVYGVAQSDRPNFVKSIGRAVSLIVLVGFGLIASTVVGSATTSAKQYGLNFVGPGLSILALLLSYLVTVATFTVAFKWLTVKPLTWRETIPGASIAALGWTLLTQLATAFVGHKLSGDKSTYGTFGGVILLLSWFYLAAQIVLLSAEVNVVKQLQLWPRTLHGAPTLEGDKRALAMYVEMERFVSSSTAAEPGEDLSVAARKS